MSEVDQLREQLALSRNLYDELFSQTEQLRDQRQQAIDALRETRPYVYNVAKDPANTGWRAETAEGVLARVDSALGEQP